MLTKGQRPLFKEFLSGGDDQVAISSKFLGDQLKCLYLYFYFKEAKDDKMCKSIEEAEVFRKTTINLGGIRLSATDLECLSRFLSNSLQKQWWQLNLHDCHIQDRNLHLVHRYLNHSGLTIKRLYLNNNYLTKSSSSCISSIVLECKVDRLSLSGNDTIGESGELYSMLTNPSCVLGVLYLSYTTLSSVAIARLFAALKDAKTLWWLTVDHCNITDDAVKDIIGGLTVNTSLGSLKMDGNHISGEVLLKVIQALSINNVLQRLHVPGYSRETGDKIRAIEGEINVKRESQGIKQLKVYVL